MPGTVAERIFVSVVVDIVTVLRMLANPPTAPPAFGAHVTTLDPEVAHAPDNSDAVGVVPSRSRPVPAVPEFRPPWLRGSAVVR